MVRTFTDMIGKTVEITFPPKRIISLVPSQTELLYDLGLDEEVVGITKFCVHPNEWFRNKKRVGGTKTVHIDIVKSLQPDLIIANKEENTREQIEELSTLFPLWTSEIHTIAEGLQMIQQLGDITGKSGEAGQIIDEIKEGFSSLRKATAPKRVAYFIWRDPWMTVGHDTFISDVITTIGWENVFADKQRYPEVSLEDLKDKDIETVLLSSEPYPFKEKHMAEIKSVLPGAEVLLVDGEMFSWYGSRMREAVGYFASLVG